MSINILISSMVTAVVYGCIGPLGSKRKKGSTGGQHSYAQHTEMGGNKPQN